MTLGNVTRITDWTHAAEKQVRQDIREEVAALLGPTLRRAAGTAPHLTLERFMQLFHESVATTDPIAMLPESGN